MLMMSELFRTGVYRVTVALDGVGDRNGSTRLLAD